MIATIPAIEIPAEGRIPLDRVIAEHGAWKVLGAALAALLGARKRRDLPISAHLRRDIGLPDLPRGPTHWPGP